MSNRKVLFLGKRNDSHSMKAREFLELYFDNPTILLGDWKDQPPKKLLEWSDLGFLNIDKSSLPTRNNLEARLIAPDGIDGRMFLVYPNYKNILYYNCSSYYAISIGLLSDKISN